MSQQPDSHDERIARLESAMQSLVGTVDKLCAKLDHVGERARPNLGLMAQWTSVLLVVIGIIASPIAYHFSKSIADMEKRSQHEFTSVAGNVKSTADVLNTSRVESLARIDTRIVEVKEAAEKAAAFVARNAEIRAEQLASTFKETLVTIDKEMRRQDDRTERLLSTASKNFELNRAGILELRVWIDGQIKSDLDELRARRQRDSK